MVSSSSSSSPSRWKAHLAMALVKFCLGAYNVLTKVALNGGVNHIVFCVLRNALVLFILAPIAFHTEKTKRPPISRHFLLWFFCLGFTGIYANQLLFLFGLRYTIPSYAAAVQPAIPVFTFIFAAIIREQVNLPRNKGRAKLAGIALCVGGAILMVLYKGPTLLGMNYTNHDATDDLINAQIQPDPDGFIGYVSLKSGLALWQIGVLCLIAHCMCMAAYLALKARLRSKYRAPLSVTAYSYLFGALLMALTGVVLAHDSRDWTLTKSEIFAVLYAGPISFALIYGLLVWSDKILGTANKKSGLALVALYNPLQPVTSTILYKIFLGSPILLGSVIGGLLIIAGLYIVTWANYKKKQSPEVDDEDPVSEELLPEDAASIEGEQEGTDIFLGLF